MHFWLICNQISDHTNNDFFCIPDIAIPSRHATSLSWCHVVWEVHRVNMYNIAGLCLLLGFIQLKLYANIYRNLLLWIPFNFANRSGSHHLYFYFPGILLHRSITVDACVVCDEGGIVFSWSLRPNVEPNLLLSFTNIVEKAYHDFSLQFFAVQT